MAKRLMAEDDDDDTSSVDRTADDNDAASRDALMNGEADVDANGFVHAI